LFQDGSYDAASLFHNVRRSIFPFIRSNPRPEAGRSHPLNAFFAFGAMLKDVLGGVFSEDEGESL
jgi:hypothetical protein